MVNFGLEKYRLGIFLVLMNFIIFMLAGWLAYQGLRQQRRVNELKELKVG
jgi:uncharacterized membrane protein YvlD (DUF360 family)